MPPKKRRGSGWERRPTSKDTLFGQLPPPEEVPIEEPPAETRWQDTPTPPNEVADPLSAGKWRKILDFAPAMWSSDYRPFLRIEDPAAQAALNALPQSSYRRRLPAEAAAAYDTKALKRARSAVGMLARVANTRAWTFSVVARSLSWFNQRVPHRVWADACEDRYVASRPRCLALLHEMRRVEPQPAWTPSPNVFVFAADQTYCWQGCQKRGRARQGAERTDSSGMPLIIRSEVYVNSVRLHVPYTLCDFSPAELVELNQGPYTKAWEEVLPALQPRAVERAELELQQELSAVVLAAMGATPPANVSLRTIMLALLSHPPNDPGGPTPMEWQEVLQKCSTQSYDDLRRIIAHGWDNASLANPEVMVLFGDGQTALRGRDTKRKFPQFHRKVLVGVGPFHQMAHFLFCAICGYWWCLVCCCCVHLGITKVGPNMKDLEHSNYEHAFTIIRVITVAIYATIVQDVTDPPPQLFLTSPDAYLARVNSGGAVVLLQFLRHVGIPALQWQRAARSGEGRKLVKLMAIALHSFRCFQYKIGCAQISMLALISYLCVHDKLAAVVFAYSAVSLLGRVGRCMAIDRLLEYVNLLQQKRMNAFIGFDTALHHTPLLRAMLHADHAYEEAVHGAAKTDDPMTKSMIFQARLLQDMFLAKLGGDWTRVDDTNPFWYTGTATPMSQGDFRYRTPWEWVHRVAQGLSRGHGRVHSESWHAYAAAFIHKGLWKRT